jgi:tetratricopeptide (TPR) repeat protein
MCLSIRLLNFLNVVNVYNALGEKELACKTIKRGMKLLQSETPSEPVAAIMLFVGYARLPGQQAPLKKRWEALQKAKQSLKAIHAASPNVLTASVYTAEGDLYYESGDLDKAIASYQKAVPANIPLNDLIDMDMLGGIWGWATLRLAELYEENGDNSKAEETLIQVYRYTSQLKDSCCIEAAARLVLLAVKQNKPDKALKWCHTLDWSLPDDPQVREKGGWEKPLVSLRKKLKAWHKKKLLEALPALTKKPIP